MPLFVRGIEARLLERSVAHYRFVDPMGWCVVGAPDQVVCLSDTITPGQLARSECTRAPGPRADPAHRGVLDAPP